MRATLLFAAVLAGRLSQEVVDPVTKVTDLLQKLLDDVKTEGSTESRTYTSFACFCERETIAKANAIDGNKAAKKTQEGNLKSLASAIEELDFEISGLNSDLDQYEAELKKSQDIRAADNAAYVELNTDLEKAVSSLTSAIGHIDGSKGKGAVAVVDTDFMQKVRQSLRMADALGMAPTDKVSQSLLQGFVEPDEHYDFHSDGILGTLNDLLKKFTAQEQKVDSEENAAQRSFTSAETKKKNQITLTESAITTKSTQRTNKEAREATLTGTNTEENAQLNDNTLYLKDLTSQCELKAREWDQRATLRGGEITALQSALDTLRNTVAGKARDSGSGGRNQVKEFVEAAPVAAVESGFVQEAVDDDADADAWSDVVFVQTAEVHKSGEAALRAKREKAVTLVKREAEKLKSVELSLLAMRMAANPFAKIKTLVQELIERLLKEAAEEATKKGWCDTALAKANTDRDWRQNDLNDLSSEIDQMTADKVQYEENVKKMNEEIGELGGAHFKATTLRNQEKGENKQTIENASDGLTALRDAIATLADFYKSASRESVEMLQTDASPVDEARGSGGLAADKKTAGVYQGKQERAGGILGMLATIESDFERQIKNTSEAEEKSQTEYIKFDRETTASIAAKSTGIHRAYGEISELSSDLKAAFFNLQQNQNLLDAAMTTLETLRPECVDTTMSTSERNSRRENEVTALKKAACVLDKEDDKLNECDGDGSWVAFLQRQ